MAEVEDAKKFAAMSEMELFVSIGADLTGKPALPVSQQELLERGQAWFKKNLQTIRGTVCPKAQQIVQENDTQKAIIAVADLLASILIHVAPFKVAALIVKAGVNKLCNEDKAMAAD
jgi:hypothetical protein